MATNTYILLVDLMTLAYHCTRKSNLFCAMVFRDNSRGMGAVHKSHHDVSRGLKGESRRLIYAAIKSLATFPSDLLDSTAEKSQIKQLIIIRHPAITDLNYAQSSPHL